MLMRMVGRASPFLLLMVVLNCSKASQADSALVAGFSWQKEIASKGKKSVEDYFLLLPSSFLDCENVSDGFPTEAARRKLIRLSDVRNGYLEFNRNSQIAVFKNRSDQRDFIAVQIGQSGAGNTCGAVNSLFQFDGKTGEWMKRDDLIPKGYTQSELYNSLSGKDIYPFFQLPRKGTVIKVLNEENDSILVLLKWDGKAFSAGKP